MKEKVWEYAAPDPKLVAAIASQMKLSYITASVLVNRGITSIEQARSFLNPSQENMFDPFLMKDMDKASDRVISALLNKEKIVVYGDYDVDGITSTAVLVDFLKGLGGQVSYYIPDRIEEGYGLSIQAIDKVSEMKPSLIITVDCGITAIAEIEYIKSRGIDVVVTDHHECKEVIPEAAAVINPHRPGCTYPFKELAGVGVVFKLIKAVSLKLTGKVPSKPADDIAALGIGTMASAANYEKYLDLVCLGTIADVVPLLSENRIIVKLGLQVLQSSNRPGLQAMLVIAGLKDRILNSFNIGYTIAPRINAAGRLGSASRAVELLLTGDYTQAVKLAEELSDENKNRQNTESQILEQVNDEIKKICDLEKVKVLVIAGEGWHHGVIGIVASRITDRYHKPCVLISVEGDIGKGSARSVEGFNLFEALNAGAHLLEKYGGHELAAGLTISKPNIDKFREFINNYAEENMEEECFDKHLQIDCYASPKEMNIQLVKELEKLEPFGCGNPAPVFAIHDMKIAETRKVGDDKHLKLKLEKDGQYSDAIGFNMGPYAENLDKQVDAAFCLEINTWNNIDRLQMNLRDIRLTEELLHTQKYYINTDQYFKNWNTLNIENNLSLTGKLLKGSFVQDPYKAVIEGRIDAIIINTLSGLKAFFAIVKKNPQALKNAYKICYTVFNGKRNGKMPVIINPDPNSCNLADFKDILLLNCFTEFPAINLMVQNTGQEKFKISDTEPENNQNSKLADLIPDRSDLAAIFRYFMKIKPEKLSEGELQEVSKIVAKEYNVQMNYFKLKRCMDIFEELELLKLDRLDNGQLEVNVKESTGTKVPLENSVIYRQLQEWKN